MKIMIRQKNTQSHHSVMQMRGLLQLCYSPDVSHNRYAFLPEFALTGVYYVLEMDCPAVWQLGAFCFSVEFQLSKLLLFCKLFIQCFYVGAIHYFITSHGSGVTPHASLYPILPCQVLCRQQLLSKCHWNDLFVQGIIMKLNSYMAVHIKEYSYGIYHLKYLLFLMFMKHLTLSSESDQVQPSP